MSLGYVPAAAIAGMIFSTLVAILVPIVLMLVALKKYKAKISSFFIGAGTFIISAMILEQILHSVVIMIWGQDTLTGNVFVYALYGALAAALFEETARFLAMKFCMKNTLDRPNAFMSGIGHGGIEAIIIMGLTGINNVLTSIMINTGALEGSLKSLDPAMRDETVSQLSSLWTTSPGLFYAGGIERLSAITLQIAFAFVMYKAVKTKDTKIVVLAYALHFAADFVMVIAANYFSIAIVEIIIALTAVATAFLAYKLNREE